MNISLSVCCIWWVNEQSVIPAFGDVFSVIGVREPQAAASEAFVKFADAHRSIEKYGIQLLKTIKPVSIDCDWWVCLARTANLCCLGLVSTFLASCCVDAPRSEHIPSQGHTRHEAHHPQVPGCEVWIFGELTTLCYLLFCVAYLICSTRSLCSAWYTV